MGPDAKKYGNQCPRHFTISNQHFTPWLNVKNVSKGDKRYDKGIAQQCTYYAAISVCKLRGQDVREQDLGMDTVMHQIGLPTVMCAVKLRTDVFMQTVATTKGGDLDHKQDHLQQVL